VGWRRLETHLGRVGLDDVAGVAALAAATCDRVLRAGGALGR